MDEMKKLIIDGQEFEIVDAAGRQRITVLENTGGSGGGGLSITEKNLILQLFNKAAYSANDAGTAYTALSNLWSGSYHSVAWEGTGYTKSNSDTVIEDGESFTSTITVNNGKMIESVTVTMGGETVQGAYSGGTITIPNVTGDIVITVTTAQMTVSSISAVYTQSGTVYDTDTLDSLKPDIVVTATFPDSSTAIIDAADYTLSGTLLEGTSTITVSYGGKTASFNVTVTHFVVSLDTVLYEEKSYRDIFMTANQLQGFDFENGLPSGVTIGAGSPTISTDDCYSTSHSVKAFGSSSTQYKSVNTTDVADWKKYANTSYFVAYKAKCTRYAKGSLGVSISNGIMPSPITAVTDGWVTTHKYTTTTNGNSISTAYIGSYSSADLDGYVDDIVIIPMTDIFTNIPTEAQMLQWYNEYCDIRKAGGV